MTYHIVTDVIFCDKLKPVNITDFRYLYFITGSSYCFTRLCPFEGLIFFFHIILIQETFTHVCSQGTSLKLT